MTDQPNDAVPPLPDLPPFAILALTPDQIRLLSIWPRVPREACGAPDLRAWARMAAMPLAHTRDLARGLFEMGAALPNGELHAHVRGYLTKLARDRLA
jgi:hypothetical protein